MARELTRTGGRDATAAVIPGRYALSVGNPRTKAPDGWNWTALSSVARLESGHTPSRKVAEYWGGDVPWIGIRDATGNHGRVIYATAENTNALGIENSSARVLPENTVCLSRTASVGYVVMMGRPMATSQDFVNWVCSEAINPHFLKYVLLAERDALMSFAVGSVHPTIYFPEVKAFHVCLPPQVEQEAIVNVLFSLDQKIELNRRMNQTLEAMARSIFRDWFVDFGPTRAKMAGAAPYLASNLWDLFPDSMDDDGRPIGCASGRLGDLAMARVDQIAPTAVARETPYIGLEHMPRRSVALDAWEGAGKVTSTKLAFGAGDILFGKLRPYFHKVGVASVDGICSSDIVVIRPRSAKASALTLACVSDKAFVDFTDRTSTGTKMPRTSWGQMSSYSIVLPSGDLMEAFQATVGPMIERIRANVLEGRTLAQTRDLLLPKLMSGEIRLKEAERVLETVE